MNLKVPAHLIKAALMKAWDVVQPLADIPMEQITRLAQEKYSQPVWNLKF